MHEFPKRIRATYVRRFNLFAIKALDGPDRGKVIDYYEHVSLGAPISYPKSDKTGPYAPVVGEWLPSLTGGCVRLSIDEERGLPQVVAMGTAEDFQQRQG